MGETPASSQRFHQPPVPPAGSCALFTVQASDDGIRGKDYAVLLDGAYQVTAGGHGFTSDNDTDDGRGNASGSSTGTSADAGAPGGGMGGIGGSRGGGETVGDYSANISGGSLTINAQGDGFESNGNASISAARWWSMGRRMTVTAHST